MIKHQMRFRYFDLYIRLNQSGNRLIYFMINVHLVVLITKAILVYNPCSYCIMIVLYYGPVAFITKQNFCIVLKGTSTLHI